MAVAPAVPGRRLAPRVLGVVSEGSVRRRPSDIVRLGLCAALVALTADAATRVTGLDRSTAALVADLPAPFGHAGRALTSTALAIAVVGLAVLVLGFRRRRLALSIVGAGLGALAVGWWLEGLVAAEATRALDPAFADGRIPVYPPLTLAVLAAIIEGAAPFLTRPARRLARALLWTTALADLVSGAALAVDLIGAIAVGVGVAALVHLVVGSPAGTPSIEDVEGDLESLGIRASAVTLVPTPDWGTTWFSARDPAGAPLDVVVHGRDAMDARIIAKLWRSIWYRSSGPRFEASRLQQVEHEAYVTLLADRFGAPVPEVLVAGRVDDDGDALFVTRRPAGVPLADAGPARVDDGVLDRAWAAAADLWRARLAHGSLHTRNVLVDDDGEVALIDFGRASSSASEAEILSDGVELLATTAALVGVERAVAAAARALGAVGLDRLAPRLQRGSLSSVGRHLTTDKVLFPALQSATSAWTGTPPVTLERLVRVSPSQIAMAGATLFGLYLLVEQLTSVSDLWSVIRGADWWWVAAAFVLGQLPNITDGLALTGSVEGTLRLGPTTMLEVANKFTGLIGGTLGTTATRIRFFQKQGLGVNAAVTGGALSSIGGFVVEVVLIAVCLAIAGDQFELPNLSVDGAEDDAAVVLAVVVVVLVVLAIGLGVPRLRGWVRGRVLPELRKAGGSLRAVLSSPRKAARLLGGQLATQVLFALTLDAACRAYGQDLDLAVLILVNSFASLIGGLAPVPGGLGAVEAGLIGGLTAAGVPNDQAVAATLTHRMVTAYLPPIWGWASLRWLRRHDDL